MGNNQTKNLDLTLIQEGETNWGSAINNNFQKIDTSHEILKNRIDSIRYSQIENTGLFISNEADYIDFTWMKNEEDYEGIKIGKLDLKTNKIIGNKIIDYISLENGRCFYVWCGVNDIDSYSKREDKEPPYNMDWKNGDILIIYKKYDSNKKEYIAEFKKLPQVLGKQYLIFNRIISNLKNNSYKVIIPNYTVQQVTFPSIIVQTYYCYNPDYGLPFELVNIPYTTEQVNSNTEITFNVDIDSTDSSYDKLYSAVFYSAVKG